MDKRLIMAVIAAGMNPLSGLDQNTSAFSIGKGSTSNKYKPHQGKQECARRLRVYSPAWYSRVSSSNG